jgi:hypothetical protein
MSLTAPERETVITLSDADGTATVHTHQRRIITKLKNNPAAELIEDISFDGTPGAVFRAAGRPDQLSRPEAKPGGDPGAVSEPAEGAGVPPSRLASVLSAKTLTRYKDFASLLNRTTRRTP